LKNIVIILVLLVSIIIYGCNKEPKITEEQAKSIVIKDHDKNIGEVKIISVIHKNNKYIVEWENKENCENGIDKIDDQNGEIIMGKVSIC
jgi:uncharacterized membrane protein YkoI